MKRALLFIVQIAFLLLCNEVGYWIVDVLNVPIPGNVVGMLLLFVLLLTNVVKLQWIEEAASFLIKHLAFFFIPIAVGLMGYGDLLLKNGVAFFIALVASLVVGLFVTGHVSQWFVKKEVQQSEQ